MRKSPKPSSGGSAPAEPGRPHEGRREFLPFARPSIGREEIDEVVRTLESGWLSTGERAMRFERELGAWVGAREALATSSCTAALHLALKAFDIGPGDEVVTSPLTFCSTVNSILHVGASPVLADVGEDGNLDAESVERAVTRRTRAIIPVHFAGLPCEMAAIREIARRAGAFVIEDAAHALGASYDGVRIGATEPADRASDAVCFSFYASKNLTTGEGGLLTTPHAEAARRMRLLRLHGITKDAWKRYSEQGSWAYEVVEPGFKYNLSDLQAAVGLGQLRKLDAFLEARRRRAALYGELLAEIDGIDAPPTPPAGRVHAWHLYTIRLRLERLEIDRAEFVRRLHAAGIGSSVHFIPIPLHRAYRGIAGLDAARCPYALELYPRLVSLPLYPALEEADVARVAGALERIARGARRRAVA